MENIKTLDFRIRSAYDDFDAWLANDPVLLRGEIVVADIQSEQENSPNYIPTVMFKVGDGKKKYSELDFTYAKAADVYEWAKKANLAYEDLPETLKNKITTLETNSVEKITNSEIEVIFNE